MFISKLCDTLKSMPKSVDSDLLLSAKFFCLQVEKGDLILAVCGVNMQTHCIFSFFHQISDPSTNRYEVPWPPRPIVSNASNTLYKVTTGSETFNFTVSRADTGQPM